jgi:hypothetical protein
MLNAPQLGRFSLQCRENKQVFAFHFNQMSSQRPPALLSWYGFFLYKLIVTQLAQLVEAQR